MKNGKFEVGDIVIALNNHRYSVTTNGYLGKVTLIESSAIMRLNGLGFRHGENFSVQNNPSWFGLLTTDGNGKIVVKYKVVYLGVSTITQATIENFLRSECCLGDGEAQQILQAICALVTDYPDYFKNAQAPLGTQMSQKPQKCVFCGETFIPGFYDSVKVKLNEKGTNYIYAHKTCCTKHEYSFKNNDKRNKTPKNGFLHGEEFETNTTTTNEQRALLKAKYGLICTSDCTVQEEFKSSINGGLRGVKEYLQGISEIIDIKNGDNIGTHANVSIASWSNTSSSFRKYIYDDNGIYSYLEIQQKLFGPLSRAVRYVDVNTRKKLFGRGFGSYRHYSDSSFCHGDWLAIKKNCLEFRLSKFHDVNQYFHLLCFYKEVCETIDKMFVQKLDKMQDEWGTMTRTKRADILQKLATKTGNALVKRFNSFADGTATYYRAERNRG